MAYRVLTPNAVELIEDSRGRMIQGSWSSGDGTCVLGALVPGATEIDDCVTAGWPRWLAGWVRKLYDAEPRTLGQWTADTWAADLATVVARPVDYNAAHQRFMIALVSRLAASDPTGRRGRYRRFAALCIMTPQSARRCNQAISIYERALAGDSDAASETRSMRDGEFGQFARMLARRRRERTGGWFDETSDLRMALLLALAESSLREPPQEHPGHARAARESGPARHASGRRIAAGVAPASRPALRRKRGHRSAASTNWRRWRRAARTVVTALIGCG